MTTARIRFGGNAHGRDLRRDVSDFMRWLESECGEAAAQLDFPDPADSADRAAGAANANADGAKLTVRVKDC